VSPETQFLDSLDQPGAAANSAQLYAAASGKNPNGPVVSELVLNRLGYDHLQDGDKKGAIAILKLNASLYPNSPNVYDSLGDAYLADGQNDLVRQNAQKAIELLAHDTTDPEDRRKGIRDSAEHLFRTVQLLGSGVPVHLTRLLSRRIPCGRERCFLETYSYGPGPESEQTQGE